VAWTKKDGPVHTQHTYHYLKNSLEKHMRACSAARGLHGALKSPPTAGFSTNHVPTIKMAGIGPPVVAPTPGCTPSSPHTQPAPLSTLPGLSCEWESVNVV
jgi:hypothetical protein